jgi:hypothetical protein
VDHKNPNKSDNKWLEMGGFESPFKSGSGNAEIRKSGVLLGEEGMGGKCSFPALKRIRNRPN